MKKFGFLLVLITMFVMTGTGWAKTWDTVTSWDVLVKTMPDVKDDDIIPLGVGNATDWKIVSNFPISFDKSVTFRINGGGVTIDASAVTTATDKYGVFSFAPGTTTGKTITLENMTIISSQDVGANNTASAIYVSADKNNDKALTLNLLNCTFNSGTREDRSVAAVYLTGAGINAVVDKCNFNIDAGFEKSWRGVRLENIPDKSSIEITRNIFTSNIKIWNNTVNPVVAVELSGDVSSDIKIDGNTVIGNMGGALVMRSKGNIRGVTFTNNNLAGLTVNGDFNSVGVAVGNGAVVGLISSDGNAADKIIYINKSVGNLFPSGAKMIAATRGSPKVRFGAETADTTDVPTIAKKLVVPSVSTATLTPTSINTNGTATASVTIGGGSGDITVLPKSSNTAVATVPGGVKAAAGVGRTAPATVSGVAVGTTDISFEISGDFMGSPFTSNTVTLTVTVVSGEVTPAEMQKEVEDGNKSVPSGTKTLPLARVTDLVNANNALKTLQKEGQVEMIVVPIMTSVDTSVPMTVKTDQAASMMTKLTASIEGGVLPSTLGGVITPLLAQLKAETGVARVDISFPRSQRDALATSESVFTMAFTLALVSPSNSSVYMGKENLLRTHRAQQTGSNVKITVSNNASDESVVKFSELAGTIFYVMTDATAKTRALNNIRSSVYSVDDLHNAGLRDVDKDNFDGYKAKIDLLSPANRENTTMLQDIIDEVNSDVKVISVSLDESVISLDVGKSQTLKATVFPTNAVSKDVTWLSDHPNIAKVDDYGKVTGVNEGITMITVTTVEGGKKAYCTVDVTEGKHSGSGGGCSATLFPLAPFLLAVPFVLRKKK